MAINMLAQGAVGMKNSPQAQEILKDKVITKKQLSSARPSKRYGDILDQIDFIKNKNIENNKIMPVDKWGKEYKSLFK